MKNADNASVSTEQPIVRENFYVVIIGIYNINQKYSRRTELNQR